MTDTKITLSATSGAPQYNLDAYWMPFSSNRTFRKRPRMFVRSEGMHFYTDEGLKLLDGTAGLWCCNCGHARKEISTAIANSARELDYAPSFQLGHPQVFELAARLAADVFPADLNTVFFANSGSEAVDSALKIALAYQGHRGATKRTKLLGRERGYHGVNFGGISVGGIPNNKKWYPNQLDVDHICHTHDLERNAFSRGLPALGVELADNLESVIKQHDAATIAALIIEPIAGSTGVLLPPQGYLKRIREICDKHEILLIFDEVITGFGRIGAATAAERFDVIPDMITFAKGVNSGTVPLGGVAMKKSISDLFLDKTAGSMIDLFHGYTYSGHPLACAAGLAALNIYRDENLFARSRELEGHWEEGLHSLKGLPHVIDIRNFGLIGAIELQPRDGEPTARAYDAFCDAFFNNGLLIRTTGDIIALSPPLIITKEQIDELVERLGNVLKRLD